MSTEIPKTSQSGKKGSNVNYIIVINSIARAIHKKNI